jgi:hypothetical protein
MRLMEKKLLSWYGTFENLHRNQATNLTTTLLIFYNSLYILTYLYSSLFTLDLQLFYLCNHARHSVLNSVSTH